MPIATKKFTGKIDIYYCNPSFREKRAGEPEIKN